MALGQPGIRRSWGQSRLVEGALRGSRYLPTSTGVFLHFTAGLATLVPLNVSPWSAPTLSGL